MNNLNQEYAVVLVGGKAAIMHFKDNGEFELMSRSDFLLYLGPLADQGKKWLESPERRTYDGIVFEPGKDTQGYYNLFRGFPVRAAAGSCQKFLAHIEQNVCHGNKDHYRWLMALVGIYVPASRTKGRKLCRRSRRSRHGKIVCRANLQAVARPICCHGQYPWPHRRTVQRASEIIVAAACGGGVLG